MRRSMMELGRAVAARVRSRDDQALSWEEAKRLAMSPPPEFALAQQVVALLRTERDLTEQQISERVEGTARAGLAKALAIARTDGFVERAGDGRWHITAFADHVLVEPADAAGADSGRVKQLFGELTRELAELRTAVAQARAGELAGIPAATLPAKPSTPAAAPAPEPGAWQTLETIRKMRDAELISEAEFELKKAEVLGRL